MEGEVVECGRGSGRGMGEARAESLVGNVGEAVVGVAGESSRSGVGTPGDRLFHPQKLSLLPQKSGFAHVMTCYDMLCTGYDTL